MEGKCRGNKGNSLTLGSEFQHVSTADLQVPTSRAVGSNWPNHPTAQRQKLHGLPWLTNYGSWVTHDKHTLHCIVHAHVWCNLARSSFFSWGGTLELHSHYWPVKQWQLESVSIHGHPGNVFVHLTTASRPSFWCHVWISTSRAISWDGRVI